MAFAALAGVLFLAGVFAENRLSDLADRLRAKEKLAADLQGRIATLHDEREDLEAEHQRQLNQVQDWLDKVAVPRETILKTAKLDAIQGTRLPFEDCYASASLELDGWNVLCGSNLSLVDPQVIRYLIDPLTGKILKKRVVEVPGSLR
jgi:hypothetical protein